MNLNFWPKMYYSGGGGGGGSGGGGGGDAGGGGGGSAAGGGAGGYGGGAGTGGYSAGGGAADEQPPEEPTPVGAFRFNTDTNHLEYYDGNQWVTVTTDTPNLHTGETRTIFAGGEVPGEVKTDVVDYIQMTTLGDAIDFGDLSESRYGGAGVSDRNRFILMGGNHTPSSPGYSNTIDGHEFASTSHFADFADLGNRTAFAGGCGDNTRGLIMGGYAANVSGYTNQIEYVTIQHLGTGQDFGDLSQAGFHQTCSMSSTTRGFVGTGIYLNPAATNQNAIEFVTISTQGNAADFGDANLAAWGRGSASNAVRGIYSCGYYNPADYFDRMDYITLASLGNGVDFGDNTLSRRNVACSASSTRMVTAGGQTSSPTWRNEIDTVEIMTLGNAVEFGDLTAHRRFLGANSNGHGGLG